MSDAILFSKCLGINDSTALGTQITTPQPRSESAGSTELLSCSNLTTSVDGAVESIPAFSTLLTHTAPITAVSARERLLFQDATNTNEWTGAASVVRFPSVVGVAVHTPIDCRVSTGSTVYRSNNTTPTMEAAAVGTNPDPTTSRTFAGMPAYTRSFIYNGRLYIVNAASPKFLQYSELYHYDLWSIADGFLGHANAITDSGAVPGVILLLHSKGVTIYTGADPTSFTQKKYLCSPIAGTLFSGFISDTVGHGHVFLCTDGVYFVGADGSFTCISRDRLKYAGALNTSYSSAGVDSGKYLAFGDAQAVEYDFDTKAIMFRATQGITAATHWEGAAYYATGDTVVSHSGASLLPTMLTLPFSDFGEYGKKKIKALFFTGVLDGDAVITAVGLEGKEWTLPVSAAGVVYNYHIKTPAVFIGNHISLSIATKTGRFRMEKLRATFVASPSRSR